MSNTTAITIENLTRDFETVRAVDNLTLEIPRGIVFGFLGPNGSGKTTTIRLLLGLLEPTEGSANVLGFDTRTQSDQIREQTGALLEHSGLYERLTAEDNLDFYGRIYRMPRAERDARIKELLSHFGLWERRKEIVREWSRGMRQKLAVARALMHHPTLIFLDEPTAGLDPIAAAALRDDLASLVAQEGVTVFLNTHNLPEAEKLCELVGVIREGELIALGHPDTLKTQAGGPRVEVIGAGFTPQVLEALNTRPEVEIAEVVNSHLEISLTTQGQVSELVSLIVGAGAQVEEIRKGKASLEEVFLGLMTEDAAEKTEE